MATKKPVKETPAMAKKEKEKMPKGKGVAVLIAPVKAMNKGGMAKKKC